jgi:hypothetical protein
MAWREEQRRRSGEERGGGRGDQRRGVGDELSGGRTRHVATYPDQVIELIPQMKKSLSHGESIYVSNAGGGVRTLTNARAFAMLAGAPMAAYA